MAGCSKKQYAIMMSSGQEGQKLASKMGSMQQEEFNKAFSELLQSDSAADASYKAENSKYSQEDDEDYGDFDADRDEDYEEEDEQLINRLKKAEVPQEQIDDLVKEFKGKDLENAVEQMEMGRPFGDVMNGTVKYEDYEPDEKPSRIKGLKNQPVNKFNNLWDSLEGASDLNAWQAEADKALEAGEISEEQYDELNEALDKKIDAKIQSNAKEDNDDDLYKEIEEEVRQNWNSLNKEKIKKEYQKLIEEEGHEEAMNDISGGYFGGNLSLDTEIGKEIAAYLNESGGSSEEPLHIRSLNEQVSRNPSYKAMADSISNDKDINDAYFYAFKDAYEKKGYEPSESDISGELSDRYWALSDVYRDRYGMSDGEWDRYGWSDFEKKYGTEEEFINKGLRAHNDYFDNLGPRNNNNNNFSDRQRMATYTAEDEIGISEYKTKDDVEKVANWLTEHGYAKDNSEAIDLIKSEMQDPSTIDRALKNEETQSQDKPKRWSDDLEDNEWTREYRSDVERMDQQKADAIAKAMEEYIAEKPQKGFINADQIKRYSEKLGLANMDDDELSQMWYDVDNVGGLYEHGKPYDKGGRELNDARSAFIELVNKEARDRRGGKTKEEALAKIKEWADEAGQYDLDDSRAYLTGKQDDYIDRAVNKHGITKSELRALHPHFFHEGGYSQYGKDDDPVAKIGDRELKLSEFVNLAGKADKDLQDVLSVIIANNYGLSEKEAEKMIVDKYYELHDHNGKLK